MAVYALRARDRPRSGEGALEICSVQCRNIELLGRRTLKGEIKWSGLTSTATEMNVQARWQRSWFRRLTLRSATGTAQRANPYLPIYAL